LGAKIKKNNGICFDHNAEIIIEKIQNKLTSGKGSI